MEDIKKSKLAKATTASFSFMGSGAGDSWSPTDVDKLEVFDIKQYHKVTDQCRFFYRKDPIAGTVIDKMIEIGISDLVFDRGKLSENEFRIFTAIKPKLKEYAEICGLEFLLSGLVIPEVRYGALSKEQLAFFGIKKYTSLSLPVSMWLRDPKTVKINSSMVLNDPSYYVVLPEELVYFIQNKGIYPDGNRDEKLYIELLTYYPEFVAQVQAGNKEILLENNLIVRRRVNTDSAYPTPYLYRSLEAMKHKRNLRRMDYSIASRVISAIQLIKLGNDEFPITEDDQDAFQAIKDQMTWRNSYGRDTERIFQLFANHTLTVEWVFPDVTALLDDKKYINVNQDIFLGLGFPRILTTGETERTQTSDPEFATISPVKTMENMQENIIKIIRGIVVQISELNGLKYIPEVKFSKINLHTFSDFVTGMLALYDSGNISRTSFAGAFGFNWEEEVKIKSEENDMLKELGVEEFSPKPYSNQPGNVQNQNNQQNSKNIDKKSKDEQ